MTQIYKDAIKSRIEQAQLDLIIHFDNIKDNIPEIMESHHKNGYYGWEFMRNPFLWRDECKQVVLNITEQVKKLGYMLYMNSKYHTVAILPNEKFSQSVTDCLVGWDNNTQFIHYTLDDHNLDIAKKWKEDAMKWQTHINKKLE